MAAVRTTDTSDMVPGPIAVGRWSNVLLVKRVDVVREAEDAGRRRPRRSVALRLDGAAWLRVAPEELAELGIADGDVLDDDRRTAVETTLARSRARRFVVNSLAVRPQSVSELERKLAAREIPQALAREAIELATGYGFVDDAELARQLAHGMRSRKYGRRRAEQKLKARGLSDEHAAAALAQAYDAGDELALARAALGRRSTVDDAARRKAVGFLVRRGFSSDAAWKAVKSDPAGD